MNHIYGAAMIGTKLERKDGPAVDTKVASIPIDVKELSEDGTFEGYVSTFSNVDRGGDVVMPGAFRRTLSEQKLHDIKLLRDHDTTKIVGEWLELREDDRGLYGKGQLFVAADDHVPLARETYTLLKRRALGAISMGYRTIKSTFDEKSGARQLIDVDLWEGSLVPFPMNTLATVDAVKGDLSITDVERILREGGAPGQFAKMVAIHGYHEATKRLGTHREGGSGGASIAEMIRATTATMKGTA